MRVKRMNPTRKHRYLSMKHKMIGCFNELEFVSGSVGCEWSGGSWATQEMHCFKRLYEAAAWKRDVYAVQTLASLVGAGDCGEVLGRPKGLRFNGG